MSDEYEIYRILTKLQQGIICPKDKENKFQGWGYRRLEDILAAAKPFMPPGAILHASDEPTQVGDRYFIKATASLKYMGKTISAEHSSELPKEEKGKQLPQLTASCSTYARKVAFCGLLALDGSTEKEAKEYSTSPFDEIDARDNTKTENPEPEQDEIVNISHERALKLSEKVREIKGNWVNILAHYGVATYDQLTVEAADHLERNLEKKRNEIKGAEYARV